MTTGCMNHHALLRQGIQAAQSQDKARARDLILQALAIQDDQEVTWLWLASVTESQSEVYRCMQHVLRINPDNERARDWLRQADALGVPEPAEDLAAAISEAAAAARSMETLQRERKDTQPFPDKWAADETVCMGNASDLFDKADGT